ncbi:tryptophan synthase beta subunit-like PLP-dependent enzyme [Yarrowia lipolytica]|jgi:cysteine synthase A|uniref:cysteine synthase n=2 Tax=Yarrowia lipolytica TaxID=4952 RepID=Q6C6L3_YARLI|nr:YALI0E08536p [Yarrowia lipolytica CLIB122]RDW27335.1 tryptophan synthase beta subunit-like PLP-dependent enzyme [Yarrowia lipolytica]RDW31753.1 tryptophan synthase beta subunit-like PLP-dependent enzyme [Yarrowia lipolytica]RDW40593.1 tryptophan synthase beta subunit-like PLP-dependent enzyme [Yarrowia lipolytica]RDW48252.1 tryptophan synthase beta subunit-like PLP-dependent enzyme [Yarrowia lipolytica]RDW54753.1 tryptophan synthase beta subunit-like PLP-dependent enzyme [Yarrowia lipolytic|eukprot:XP_503699.1 YALI0E08536p [Yarrowia lipolytica CLIB122]
MSRWIYTASGVLIGISISGILYTAFLRPESQKKRSKSNKNTPSQPIVDPPKARIGLQGLIGNTPMVLVPSLSHATGCKIYAKVEACNPGGSAKDRVALGIIQAAEKSGAIAPHEGHVIYEGTSGSTGISLAMLSKAMGYNSHICLPDDTSSEKVDLLTNLGAVVDKVRPAGIVDKNHYVNSARDKAVECETGAVFSDQFENDANWRIHYNTTGPEIFIQTDGEVDLFVTGSGTGGTISGVAKYLKEKLDDVRVVLADCQGSGLYRKIKYGVMYDSVEKEGTRRRHQVDTLVEGIGINRITHNLSQGLEFIDDAIRVTDEEAVKMAKYLVDNDGMFVGSSTAVNMVAAYKCAKSLGPNHTIVTLWCDGGHRHLSKFWKQARELGEIKLEDF